RSEATGKPLWVHWRGCKYRKEIDAAKLADADCSLQELVKRFADGTPPVKVVACAECIKDEIDAVMHLVKPLKCDTPVEVAEGVRAKLLDAGHIPGSASVLFEVALNGPRRVLFSGDLGNTLSPLSSGPHAAPACDAVFIESTYGPAHRDPSVKEHRQLFRRAVAEAVRRGGVVWIPCFSLDRTQKILYELHLAQQERLLPNELPIYCPSPTAREVTSLYKAHRRDGWFTPAIAADPLAFQPAEVRTTIPSARRLPHPCIIISTSDILLTEWMRRLLTDLLPDPSTAVLLVSYQDPESAGGLLKKGARKLEIGGQSAPVRANVQSFQCFTGHGDAVDIDRWLAAVPQAATVVLVHGDKEELGARADQLREQGRRRVIIAERGKTIDLLRASSERTLAPPVTP
ncbi:MAG: MBL fold metallo-hydrolase, partial [Thermoguttaceae bacterium]